MSDNESESTLGETSNAILRAAVRRLTKSGPTPPPRKGQVDLLNDVAEAFRTNTHVLGEAGTGTGKSLAYLAPAAAAAARGERTVISTEMISLQTQIIDKDAPNVADACEEVTGYRPSVALFKGWRNYACTAATVDAAQGELGVEHKVFTENTLRSLLNGLQRRISAARGKGAETLRENLGLLRWSLDQSLGEHTGDRATYEDDLSEEQWARVSVSSADCVGATKCPVADFCLPRRARENAENADIIVTNHTLMGIQAANNVPVVIGNKKIGRIDHVVVDEAHFLPAITRAQGAKEVSGEQIRRTARVLEHLIDPSDKVAVRHLSHAAQLADALDSELRTWTARIDKREEALRLKEGDNPVESTYEPILAWVKSSSNMLKKISPDTSVKVQIRLRRTRNRVDALAAAIKTVALHESSTVRWVETKWHEHDGKRTPYPAVLFSPVDVSFMLNGSLWNATDWDAMEDIDVDEEEPPTYPLSVVALSATIPDGYAREAGLRAQLRHYESPFASAYSNSVLYVPPAIDPADKAALQNHFGKFNTSLHIEWAAGILADLIEANGGRALVLAATVEAGKRYAEHLRTAAKGRWHVLSQWDGPPLRMQTSRWKRDEQSVLIGVKSLMTGVDLAGEGNSLVVLDRIPRARQNPVDDARAELMTQSGQVSAFVARELIYAGDAATLLDQASGRLIRQIDDSGMVAVLDPRLRSEHATFQRYGQPALGIYSDAVARFTNRVTTTPKAIEWLQARRAQLDADPAIAV